MSTICAISTAQGGAIGIVRVSGKDALTVVDAIFCPANGRSLAEAKPNTVHFGKIIGNKESGLDEVDEVLVSIYRAPHSYTGEDSAEIMCHGSSFILQKVVTLLCEHGCELARSGEYTQRAFLNGKMDLSQAEAVADLISSSNEATHRLAMSQMRGGFSSELRQLREQLLEITSLLELEIDFSEEDVQFADREKLYALVTKVENRISGLVDSFQAGNALKNGIPVAIIGEPNVGKSTLLNRLLHDDRAIVSDVRGTTRDTIEETITIQGILFRFIDTAGIHDTEDVVETMGIERTIRKVKDAQIVIMMKEPGVPYPDIPTNEKQHIIKVENKTSAFQALTGIGIDELEQQLIATARQLQHTDSDIIVTNLRHVEALRQALLSIQKVKDSLNPQASKSLCQQYPSSDIIALDLHDCIDHLAEITGDITSDDTLHSIFKNFCIGK